MQLIEEYTSVSFIPAPLKLGTAASFFGAHGHSTVKLLGMLYLPVASQATCMLAKDNICGLWQETLIPIR